VVNRVRLYMTGTLAKLKNRGAHYAICIKPDAKAAAGTFDGNRVS
jgi:hypothetical protein